MRADEVSQTGPTTNPAFALRIDWIVKNRERENIVFVSHVGDITDVHSESQWALASNLMARLDGVVPYGISPVQGEKTFADTGFAAFKLFG